MNINTLPPWAILIGTVIIAWLAFHAGMKLGSAAKKRHPDKEKSAPISTIVGSILSLLAFMLAITFGIVNDRYSTRKKLVRDEANAIGTAYLRTDFLTEPQHSESAKLFRKYVEIRLAGARKDDADQMNKDLMETAQIQKQLWNMAVVNARKDTNSHVAGLYVQSLNEVIDIHGLRVAVGLKARLPNGFWILLYCLFISGLIGVGYHFAIADSRGSWILPILALSFAIVFTLISVLDNPESKFIKVSQQPLIDLQTSIAADSKTP